MAQTIRGPILARAIARAIALPDIGRMDYARPTSPRGAISSHAGHLVAQYPF